MTTNPLGTFIFIRFFISPRFAILLPTWSARSLSTSLTGKTNGPFLRVLLLLNLRFDSNQYALLISEYQIQGADSNLQVIQGGKQSADDLKDFVDDGYDPSVDKVEGVKLTDTTTDVTNPVSSPATLWK